MAGESGDGMELLLTGRDLTLEEVEQVAGDPTARVRLDPRARKEIVRARTFVEELLEGDETIYGVSTGFGRLAEVVISDDRRSALQRNLIRSHAAGVGEDLSRRVVRAIMLLRANALARGNSGCRLAVVERLLDYLNRGVHPRVPEFGSVGASGDLAPLAHVALTLIGEGRVEVEGRFRPTEELLEELGIEPLKLEAKEGLALINGTQAMTAVGILTLLAAERAVECAEVAGAMSLEGLRGTPVAFRREVQEVRPHAGQARSAARLRALMADSEIRESHRHGDPRVQDAYSLRCMPQVHGAAREAFSHVRKVLSVEANSATDNPLVFPEAGRVVSAGNFHGQIVSQALDFLTLAVTDLASIAERRIERLLNPDLSGHPAFLSPDPGIHSGFMIVQVTAADLLGEMRTLAHPASVDSVPTSASQEDHVSMGMAAARKAARAVECLEFVLAAELLCAAQAVDLLRPLRPGRGVEAAHRVLRERVPPLDEDRVLSGDLEEVGSLVRSGALVEAAGEEG